MDGDNPACAAAASAKAFDQLLAQRHSCRAFLPKPVPRELIERLLATAQRSASWCNVQPWQLLVLSGAATVRFRDALLAHVQAHPQAQPDIEFPREYAGVHLQRRRECGFALYNAVGVARGDRVASARQGLENYKFFGAPHLALVSTEAALGTYGAVDCGGYVANFMSAAVSLGLASIAQAALASYSQFVRGYFALPDKRQFLCGISFGYEDAAHPANRFRTTRAPLDQVVTWLDA
jgi:nitroreductase